MNSTIAALPHLLEIMNEANGMSVGASERGQRVSFNEADGISGMEGKAAMASGE